MLAGAGGGLSWRYRVARVAFPTWAGACGIESLVGLAVHTPRKPAAAGHLVHHRATEGHGGRCGETRPLSLWQMPPRPVTVGTPAGSRVQKEHRGMGACSPHQQPGAYHTATLHRRACITQTQKSGLLLERSNPTKPDIRSAARPLARAAVEAGAPDGSNRPSPAANGE